MTAGRACHTAWRWTIRSACSGWQYWTLFPRTGCSTLSTKRWLPPRITGFSSSNPTTCPNSSSGERENAFCATRSGVLQRPILLKPWPNTCVVLMRQPFTLHARTIAPEQVLTWCTTRLTDSRAKESPAPSWRCGAPRGMSGARRTCYESGASTPQTCAARRCRAGIFWQKRCRTRRTRSCARSCWTRRSTSAAHRCGARLVAPPNWWGQLRYAVPSLAGLCRIVRVLWGQQWVENFRYIALTPETGAGEGGAFHERTQLGPHDTFGYQIPAGIGAKPAIGTGNHPTAIPYGVDRLTDAIGYDFGMLDIVSRRIDHARQKEHRLR